MIHEGMTLDVSGHHLALLEWAGAVRQLVLLTLVANLFVPWGVAGTITWATLGLSLAAWIAKLVVFAVVVAIVESTNAKLRLFRVPELMATSLGLGFLALALRFL
jgi:formate hydrogenlyase subunit 4